MSLDIVRNQHAAGAVRTWASSGADLAENSLSLGMPSSCLSLTRRRCLNAFHLQM